MCDRLLAEGWRVTGLDNFDPFYERWRKERNLAAALSHPDFKLIEADGWREVATKGSHRQFKHPTKTGRVTIAGKPSDDLAPGTYNSILKQADLKP